MLEKILEHNQRFVESGGYKGFETSKYPNKKIAVLSCMDTRLTALLPAALGIKNGDAKLIKNAGALVTHPYGSVMRSLLVCVFELGIEEIFVIGHYDCGMQHLNSKQMTEKMLAAGISAQTIEQVKSEVDYDKWLTGFGDVEASVRNTTAIIRNHPLIPAMIKVYGMVMSPVTGQLDLIDE